MARKCEILSKLARKCEVLSNLARSVRYCQKWQENVRYCQNWQENVRYCQNWQGMAGCAEMGQSARKCLRLNFTQFVKYTFSLYVNCTSNSFSKGYRGCLSVNQLVCTTFFSRKVKMPKAPNLWARRVLGQVARRAAIGKPSFKKTKQNFMK